VFIATLQDAIAAQAAINRFLASSGIKDLVGDYGELLVHKALGGTRRNAVNRGFDIDHEVFLRVEVKTRQYELLQDGTVRRESRAVGFKGKEDGFDWLAHVILDVDFSVLGACLVSYQNVWPEIERTKDKVGYQTSSRLPSSRDITQQVKTAQLDLGFRTGS
jgi:hypothetical protein